MNHAFEILMVLVFFVPVGLMVALNLLAYREERYVAQPPAPMMSSGRAGEPVAAEPSNDFDLRQAA